MGHQQSRGYGEEAAKKYPHYKTYMECQSRAFSMGTASLIVGGASTFLVQEALRKFAPQPIGLRVIMPVIGGSIVGYVYTRQRTKACQDMWLALEERHSALAPHEVADSMNSGSDGIASR